MQTDKKNTSMLENRSSTSHSKAPKTQQVAGYKHKRKNSGLFDGTKRVLTLASTIILLTHL